MKLETWKALFAALRGNKENQKTLRAGMTLIEIMIVVTLMAAIMAMVGINVMNSADTANEGLAETQIGNFKSSIEMYRVQYKKYPDKLDDLVNTPNGLSIINEIPADPWGNPYIFEKNGNKITISSSGKDGIPGNEDDVSKNVI